MFHDKFVYTNFKIEPIVTINKIALTKLTLM